MGFIKNLKSKVSKKNNGDLVLETIKNANLNTYEKGFEKTNSSLTKKLNKLANSGIKIDDEYFDELEEVLLLSDISYSTCNKIIISLKKRIIKEKVSELNEVNDLLFEEIYNIYGESDSELIFNNEGISVFLVIGVNGAGKTTSIAKMANLLKNSGKTVSVIAADTFRAGAVAQLSEWANRLDIHITKPDKDGQDPASVVFKGIDNAIEVGADVVLCDTSGRLQNNVNLMKELEKINTIINKKIEGGSTETLLVIDGTTGQNGVSQAKKFSEVTDVTGLIVTKLDGTSKGGILVSVKDVVGIPVKFLGLGEKIGDLQKFDLEDYVYSLASGVENE